MHLDDRTPPAPMTNAEIFEELVPCLVVVQGEPKGKIYPLQRNIIRLGREPGNDILLDGSSASRRHAEIHISLQKDTFTLVDLNSTNGTFIHNTNVTSAPLQPGDLIYIGDYIFKFTFSDQFQLNYQKQIEDSAQFDNLTGLYTSKSVLTYIHQEVLRAERYIRDFSILILDVDLFKNVNDTYGHLIGSQLLKDLAQMIQTNIRKNVDRPGRYGGDEFLVLLPETPKKSAVNVAERLRKSVETQIFRYDPHQISVTLSIGLASFKEDHQPGASSLELINIADKALYQAKKMGRNRIYYIGRFTTTSVIQELSD